MCWLDMKTKGGQKITLGIIYKKFQIWRQLWMITHEEQVRRWNRMLESWKKAGVKRDTVVMGDINIDFKV